jgi:hypothetical protein
VIVSTTRADLYVIDTEADPVRAERIEGIGKRMILLADITGSRSAVNSTPPARRPQAADRLCQPRRTEGWRLFWCDARFAPSHRRRRDRRRAWRMTPLGRLRARRIAVDSLGNDFVQRGASETMLDAGVDPQDPPCPVHGFAAEVLPVGETRWPRPSRDRALARDAYASGCHVLLSEDRDMLRCGSSLFARGMAVLRPVELLEALDTAGELEPLGGDRPYPDTATLARFYSLRSPQDA